MNKMRCTRLVKVFAEYVQTTVPATEKKSQSLFDTLINFNNNCIKANIYQFLVLSMVLQVFF